MSDDSGGLGRRNLILAGGALGASALVAIHEAAPASDLRGAEPHGHPLPIGTFSSASSQMIDTATLLVQTAGYNDAGAGGAIYIHDAAVDAAHVGRHSRSSFISRNGRGFRLSERQVIRPEMFGAVHWRNPGFDPLNALDVSGCIDSTLALQAFYDFVFDVEALETDCTGRFGMSATLFIGPTTRRLETCISLSGNLVLVAIGAIGGPMIEARNLRDHRWRGSITCIGRGGTAFGQRDVECGIRFGGDCASFELSGRFSSYYMAFAGMVAITRSSGDFLEWLKIREVAAYGCGSAMIVENGVSHPNHGLSSKYQVVGNRGVADDPGQGAVLHVSTMPPAYLTKYGRLGVDHVLFVLIGEILYRVTDLDQSRKQLVVFPWIRNGTSGAGRLTYIFGGNLLSGGQDGNLCDIGSANAAATSINYQCCALFPGTIRNVTAQSCTVNVAIAAGQNVVRGGITAGLYEENCLFGVVNSALGNARHTLLDIDRANLGTWRSLAPSDGDRSLADVGFQGIAIFGRNGKMLTGVRHPQGAEETPGREGGDYAVDGSMVTISSADNFTVLLRPFDRELDRLFGIDWLRMTITGTGPDGEPRGAIIVDAARLAGRTINGQPKIRFESSGCPLDLVITADAVTGNFKIFAMSEVRAVSSVEKS